VTRTNPARAAMDAALHEIVISDLRRRGFTGRYPHFRRRREDRIDLLSFQFYSSGGKFVVEIAVSGPQGFRHAWGKVRGPSEVTAQDISSPLERPRLGSGGRGDHWFTFGGQVYEPGHDLARPPRHYEDVARQVLSLIDSEAEPFWSRTQPQTGLQGEGQQP
jgi:hypothetical protein